MHSTEMQIDVPAALISSLRPSRGGCHGCFYDDIRASTMMTECGWLCQCDTQPGVGRLGSWCAQQEDEIKLINRDGRKYGIALTRKCSAALWLCGSLPQR